MMSTANSLFLPREEFIDLRNVQDQQLNAELKSVRTSIEQATRHLMDKIDHVRAELEQRMHDLQTELKNDHNRPNAFNRNNILSNPTLPINPIVAIYPDNGPVLPRMHLFPRNAKQFYALRKPTTEMQLQMLNDNNDDNEDKYDYNTYNDDDFDGASPVQSKLAPRDAAVFCPQRAVEKLEQILGLNEENFINFRERARLRSPPRAVKRQHIPGLGDDHQMRPAPPKRIPKPIHGKAQLPLAKPEQGPTPMPPLDESLCGEEDKTKSASSGKTRLTWDHSDGMQFQRMLLGTRYACSSGGSSTNIDTLSRDD
ncbi:wac domain-containing protein [Colletotrichum incanum]|uniref:Wac domain-containing protein n=1 Tax=Colletotrichum incanum TaxID=1573173 RepID=A0A167DR09_COLIC|nr:wac domain-containing protein [Colletotrichum incanum]OHW95987.1 hypothetical protein CSPAE12_05365 [Colletotrichum incanum]